MWAARTASRKLDEGCSIADAEAVCGPEVLQQIFRWKTKMSVYLSPFLYGMRYTSFGRHFTKVEKLEQIVDKLHWYVKTGDTIVDFCCGANDFSIMMKRKLEDSGKNCYYKNYDLFQAKLNYQEFPVTSFLHDFYLKDSSLNLVRYKFKKSMEPDWGQYSVWDYHLVDEKAECVSFHILPVQWSDGERLGGEEVKIYLHGTFDNGLPKVCKRVIAWKFDILSQVPEISVLSEENRWIKLGKPRKSFEDTIRSILITVHCIHYVMRNRETSGDSVWNHLCEVFRLYAVRPSQSDLVDHMPLISDCVNRYRGLEDSKFLATLFEEKTMKRKLSNDTEARKKLKIIIDDIKDDKIDEAEDEENDNLFGEVCALCDDGGKIICCEGGCLRSFHATEEAGAGSYCKSLGFMPDDVAGMQNFYCKNCEHKQHQCFVCGKLGSSDKSSGAAEVVSCVSPSCGRFYHPHCVAILLNQYTGVPAKELERKIAGGESFTCPIHKCCICKQGENKKDKEFQFAVCLRCPKSYHRKCLPREIAFENQGQMLEGSSITRAWDGLLPNRILVYCTEHDIDIEIGTVRRDHIKFPHVKQNTSTLKKKTILEEKWKPISEFLVEGDKVVSKRNISLEKSHKGKNASTKKPYLQKKKTKKLMSGQKPVSKKSNVSPEESVGQSSDLVLSKLVKQKLSSIKEKKTNIKGKTIVEQKKVQLTSMISIGRDEAVSKRRTSSSEGLFRARSAPDPSKSCMHCGLGKGRIHFNIPDNEGRRCTESNGENSGKPYLNWKKQEKRTEFDLVPQPVPQFSRGNYLAGQNSVYDLVRAFSSSFYSHIGTVADSLSSINKLAMPSDALTLVGPTAPQPGYLDRPMGFAPGPHLNYSLQNSAGWIDD